MNKVFLAVLIAAAAVPALAAGDPATSQATSPATEQYRDTLTANLPYSATRTTTTHKLLGDGNEIVTEEVSRIYRDSIGRTRTDTLDKRGDIARTGITGADGICHTLDHRRRTATTCTRMRATRSSKDNAIEVSGQGVTPERLEQFKARLLAMARQEDQTTRAVKPLGERQIGGFRADGHEFRRKIAADAVGNSLPIEIVGENWWSKELKIALHYRQNDPRSGERATTLSNIERAEPDAALFEIPGDYTVVNSMLDVSIAR